MIKYENGDIERDVTGLSCQYATDAVAFKLALHTGNMYYPG